MSLPAIEARYRDLRVQVGKSALNALFPKEFEFYMLAIELVNSQGETEDYFSWPILPEEIRDTSNEITRITKTIGGVNVVVNSSFVPTQIFIKGNFGRRFKVLINNNKIELFGFGFSNKKISKPNFTLGVPQFSSFAKTGYGCIKMLQSIKEKSKQLDGYQKPFSLYLYNPILGDNYQVEFNSFTHSQDVGRNMIPNYSLQLSSVADLDSVLGKSGSMKSALKNLTISGLQRGANSIASAIRRAL